MGEKVLDPCLQALETFGVRRGEAEGVRTSLEVHPPLFKIWDTVSACHLFMRLSELCRNLGSLPFTVLLQHQRHSSLVHYSNQGSSGPQKSKVCGRTQPNPPGGPRSPFPVLRAGAGTGGCLQVVLALLPSPSPWSPMESLEPSDDSRHPCPRKEDGGALWVCPGSL